MPANLVSSATYMFPVGKSGVYLPFSLVNPTTGSGSVTAQVEPFNSGSGGSADGTGLTAISALEYWSLVTSGNFTNSSVSIARPTSIAPNDAIGGGGTVNGV
ncbi:MAG: hypothetical protein IPJ37_02960 [Bacteroidales bacterium]|nr:hypothetical protein [Bacteroidales bacterium]